MKKRILSVILSVVLVIGVFTGCSSKPATDGTDPGVTAKRRR